MNKYARIAVEAARSLRDGRRPDPVEAWEEAAREVAPQAPTSGSKPCPRTAFLGLCEAGLVLGFAPRGRTFSKGVGNKKKGLVALDLLKADQSLLDRKGDWWRRTAGPKGRPRHEGVLDVVEGLWRAGFVAKGRG